MQIRLLLITGLLVFLVPPGCHREKKITGKDFMPREVLVDVLVDIHLMDGITNDRKFYRRYEDVDSLDILGPILEKHHVTLHMFDTTLFEYSRYPGLLDQVYNDVLMKLNIMRDENDKELEVSRPKV